MNTPPVHLPGDKGEATACGQFDGVVAGIQVALVSHGNPNEVNLPRLPRPHNSLKPCATPADRANMVNTDHQPKGKTMRRTLVILGIGCAATVLGAGTAQAGEQPSHTNPIVSGHKVAQHHGHKHHPTCGGKCTPAPTPPAGGWPCQTTHSCKPPKVPHCRPPHHHHPKPPPVKPPVTPPTHVTPKPPIVKHPHVTVHRTPAKPATPTARVRVPVASATPQLAYTGATSDQLKVAGLGGGLLVGGTALVLLTSPLRAFNRKARVR